MSSAIWTQRSSVSWGVFFGSLNLNLHRCSGKIFFKICKLGPRRVKLEQCFSHSLISWGFLLIGGSEHARNQQLSKCCSKCTLSVVPGSIMTPYQGGKLAFLKPWLHIWFLVEPVSLEEIVASSSSNTSSLGGCSCRAKFSTTVDKIPSHRSCFLLD